jgi:hypothetical protein
LEPFGLEAGFRENVHGPFDGVGGDNKINILSHHRFCRPMIDRDPADGAPRNVRSLQAVNQTHHIIGATDRLPVIEFLCCHADILPLLKGDASLFGRMTKTKPSRNGDANREGLELEKLKTEPSKG